MSIPLLHIPVAGRLKYFANFWYSLTSDPEIIQTVTGLQLDFVDTVTQIAPLPELKFSLEEQRATDEEIETLLKKGAIVRSEHEHGEFVSNVFL